MFRSCANGAERTLGTLAAKWRAEVWGSPIRHSLSPALHNAAYAALGFSAVYSSREVSGETLAECLHSLAPDFRGVSLTMPLKEAILPLVKDHRGLVDELGAANTIVVDPEGAYLWNTDPAGAAGALREANIGGVSAAIVLGAGATARAIVAALPGTGATSITVVSRDAARAEKTLSYGRSLGLGVEWVDFANLAQVKSADLVVSTLPPGASVAANISDELASMAALLDVTYDPWPSELAMRFGASGAPVVSGKAMLLHQAVAQIRLFVGGDADVALPGEDSIVAQMRAVVS